MYCTEFGQEIPSGNAFSLEGSNVGADPATTNGSAQIKKKKKKKKKIP